MELSEIAKDLWNFYRMDWQENPEFRKERNAIAAVRGAFDELRALEYYVVDGTPTMRTLCYREKDRGSLVLVTGEGKPTHFGCDAMPAYHKTMKCRLQDSGALGVELSTMPSMLAADSKRRQRTVRHMVLPALDAVTETFIRYIDAHSAYLLQAHR
jgi:hypothetical protein